MTFDPISVKRLGILSYLAKKKSLLNWNQPMPPTFDLCKQLLNETLRLEEYTYNLNNKASTF